MNPWLWNQQQFWMGLNPGQFNFQQQQSFGPMMNGPNLNNNNYMGPRHQQFQQQRPRFQTFSPRQQQHHSPGMSGSSYDHRELQEARKALSNSVDQAGSTYWRPMPGGGPNLWEGMAGMMEHIKEPFPLPPQGQAGPQAAICRPDTLAQQNATAASRNPVEARLASAMNISNTAASRNPIEAKLASAMNISNSASTSQNQLTPVPSKKCKRVSETEVTSIVVSDDDSDVQEVPPPGGTTAPTSTPPHNSSSAKVNQKTSASKASNVTSSTKKLTKKAWKRKMKKQAKLQAAQNSNTATTKATPESQSDLNTSSVNSSGSVVSSTKKEKKATSESQSDLNTSSLNSSGSVVSSTKKEKKATSESQSDLNTSSLNSSGSVVSSTKKEKKKKKPKKPKKGKPANATISATSFLNDNDTDLDLLEAIDPNTRKRKIISLSEFRDNPS